MEASEAHERMDEAAHGHGGDQFSKRVALLIAVLAALLAVTELGERNASKRFIAEDVRSNDLWAFFQAKTIRQTVVRTAGELLEAEAPLLPSDARAAADKRLAQWRDAAARYESEPSTGEGRHELLERAQAAEAARDHAHAADELFEKAAAALQLAIVLASAAVITRVVGLAYLAGGLGVIGLAICAVGWIAPDVLHF